MKFISPCSKEATINRTKQQVSIQEKHHGKAENVLKKVVRLHTT